MVDTLGCEEDVLGVCENKYKALIAGAATAATGLDRVFASLGAPAGVHWALAGMSTDVYCRKEVDYRQLVYCAAGGYAAGLVVVLARRAGLFPNALINI